MPHPRVPADERKKKIFVTADLGPGTLLPLEEAGHEVEVYSGFEPPPRSLLLEKVRSGISALISTARDPLDEEVMRAGQGTLRIIAQYAVGYDNVDLGAASRFGIPFANTADVLTDATAEFAFFMMGCLSRKLYPAEQLVRSLEWKGWHAYLPFLGEEVSGKTVAVIGAGRIGRSFLLKCSGFDLDLLFHSRTRDRTFEGALQNLQDYRYRLGLSKRRSLARYATFDEALAQADFLSLHVPLTDATAGLIGREAFELMKPTAYLINTSRGAVVDERALSDALRRKRIAGAALDVYETEPLPENSPLRDPALESSLRLFPHFGSAAVRTRLSSDPGEGMAGRCIQAVLDVLDGNHDPGRMPFVVNRSAFQHPPT